MNTPEQNRLRVGRSRAIRTSRGSREGIKRGTAPKPREVTAPPSGRRARPRLNSRQGMRRFDA